MTLFIALGAVALLAGLAVLTTGLRAPVGEPRRAAMTIGGTMAAAFGIILVGFAIAWSLAAPVELNSGAAQ